MVKNDSFFLWTDAQSWHNTEKFFEDTKKRTESEKQLSGKRKDEKMEEVMILADKIINLRKKNGWSQEELAEKLGVTRQSISKYEGAQSIPDLDKILKLSEIFGVTTDYLIKDELEEERRLFYVAVTRAKTRLYLSSYAAKSEGFPVRPSAFIQDIDYNLLECVGNVVQNGQTTPQMLPKKTFDVGDKVEHKIFGVGTIVDINLSTQSYEIDFEKLTGTRKIMFRAELKKV